ncbi:MAG: CsiV family protein, partial [Natronospirillum sp.]
NPYNSEQRSVYSLESRSPTFRMGPRYVPVESALFKENRRMRSNELHYIDHPRLGLIIQFTPYMPVQISAEGEFQSGGIDAEGDDMDTIDLDDADMEGEEP